MLESTTALDPSAGIDRTEFDIDGMGADDLNALPFGAIKVDSEGRIIFYNEAESQLSGRSPERVIGRLFFHEVAPCANMPGFYGRFVDAVVAKKADCSFTFVFDFAMRPVRVRIDMRPAAEANRYWILIRPIEFIETGERSEAQRIVEAARVRVVGETVDTTICDREEIHMPGAIQPHGALVAISADLSRISVVSANFEDICGIPASGIIGSSPGVLFQGVFLNLLHERVGQLDFRESGSVKLIGGDRWYSFIAHKTGDSIALELQSEASREPIEGFHIDRDQAFVEAFFSSLIARPAGAFLAQEAARQFRAYTGFDRVLIYQFDTVGNGQVVAEDKVTDWDQTLVGLNFPASDIPKQARDLYLRNRIRHTPNNAYLQVPLIYEERVGTDRNLDLGNSVLRSISPIHREYHRNMGVVSSFSVSLLVDGELWGLVIGHHRVPRHLTWRNLAALERAAELLGPSMGQAESHETQALKKHHEKLHRAFLEQLAASEDLLDSLEKGPISLTDLFADCMGAVALIGGRLILVGQTPLPPVVRKLIDWLRETVEEDVWSTDCLSGYLPEFLEQKEVVSGVLVSFLTPNRNDLVMWFRPEAIEAIVWAGDPSEKLMRDGALLPRKRFEHWVELRSAHSRPWPSWKQELVARLSHAITAVLSAQFVKLKILNEKLELASSVKDRFLAQMSHELRTPLNAVIGFSELISSGFAGPTTAKQSEYLNDILTAGNHLLSLINDILEISRLEAGKYVVSPIDLDVTASTRRVLEILRPQASQRGVKLYAPEDRPIRITTDERALTQILMNLLSNAIKFTSPGGEVTVAIDVVGEIVEIRVRDTGIGMDAETLSELGKPFFQVQGAYMAANGTGLGLSIVLALIKANGGHLKVESEVGEGTVVTVILPVSRADESESPSQFLDKTG